MIDENKIKECERINKLYVEATINVDVLSDIITKLVSQLNDDEIKEYAKLTEIDIKDIDKKKRILVKKYGYEYNKTKEGFLYMYRVKDGV